MSEIIVVAEHRQGEIRPVVLELISAAVELKQQKESKVSVVVIAQDPQAFIPAVSKAGVDEVIAVISPTNEFQPDIYKSTLFALIESRNPAVMLIPHSVDGWGYAPALGATGKYGFTTDVFGIKYDGDNLVATRAAYKEKVHIELDFPGKDTVILTVRGGTFDPVEESASPEVTHFALPDATARSEHKQFIEPEDTGDIDITQSEFMFSIGRGIAEETNVEQFSELADAVGATLGCSRPIADSGWLPKSRQVGQSGKTVGRCTLYIANGISGSVQHQAGMKHVETIIAINTDPEASMMSIARYGIVADIFDIAEELITHFE